MRDDDTYLLGHRDWKPWRHDASGGEVVPYGIFGITDNVIIGGDNIRKGSEPSSSSTIYAVNGPSTISTSRPCGLYQTGHELWLRYDGDTPSIGDKFGPKSGQSTAVKDSAPLLWECTGISNASHKVMRARWLGASPSLTARILKGDADPGVTDIDAYAVNSDGTADTSTIVKIQNTHPGTFRGYGDDHTGIDATTAAKVWTAIGADGKEQIVYGNGLAKRCSGILNVGAWIRQQSSIATYTTVGVKSVVPLDGGQSPVASSSTVLDCHVGKEMFADKAAVCEIEWNENTGVYDITWAYPIAKVISGTLSASLSTGEASSNIINILGWRYYPNRVLRAIERRFIRWWILWRFVYCRFG